MRDNYYKSFKRLFSTCLMLAAMTAGVNAQLILEREFVGAVATTSTRISEGTTQQLQVDASFGETMIGYEEGDIVITVGFHQPGSLGVENNLGNRPGIQAPEEVVDVSVKAYPNPTISSLTVDLGPLYEDFRELRLVDVYGRTLVTRRINAQEQVTINQLEDLPNANYFLQGITKDGRLHQLSTIMVIKE
ncbi:hypothetical protein FUA23_05420 [Neolewinella aurantiaca]|uniref:Secretion system C-terminal sorting domain-containing protein n=1 Tax=Neolewinella aurantiaca TaxID=2602767 RepID=A0A5C7FHF3_9BACT|nr:T9SS type A sorting domain-containing protein [Neolewinella aurantiaca]TXF90537.1 hypothetical protein FUA23_05420 [Neolewinella aurantiaca]